MNDTFISYSRKDKEFINQLANSLVESECSYWLDEIDLAPAELWRDELKSAIIDSDNFIFVISPNSISSPHCNMELDFAAEHNKRIIPVVYQQIDEVEKLSKHLSGRQWLQHDNDFPGFFARILKTIRNEFKWRRQGTNYLRRAENWDTGDGGLLPRIELDAARSWIEEGVKITPGPLELQVRYIHESEAFHLNEAAKWEALYGKSLAKQLAAQSQILVDQQGVLLETAALLAVESMRRSPSLESDQAIRKVLALLPRRVTHIEVSDADSFKDAVISTDGKTIVTHCKDNTVRVWDTLSGEQLSQIANVGARKIILRPGYQQILTLNGKAIIWSTLYGNQLREITVDHVVDAAYSSDGDFLAVIGNESKTFLLDADDYQIIATYHHSKAMHRVAIAPEAAEVITWNLDIAEIFRSAGEPQSQLPLGRASNFEYSPDGKRLAQVAPMDFTATLFDVGSKQQLLFEDRHWHIAFSGDGNYFALASPEWDAYSYDLPSCWCAGHYWEPSTNPGMMQRKNIHERVSCKRSNSIHHSDSVNTVALSHSGFLMGTTSRDGTARVWERNRGREVLRLLEKTEGPIRQLTFHHNEPLVTAWGEKCWSTWQAVGHRQVAALSHDDGIHDVDFSRDGKRVATISMDNTCRIWSIPDGIELARIDTNLGRMRSSISFSPGGEKILINNLSVVDIATTAIVSSLAKVDNCYLTRLSSNWQYIARVFEDNSVTINNFDDDKEIAQLPSLVTRITSLDINVEQSIVVFAVEDNGIGLWHWSKTTRVKNINIESKVRAVRFDNSGRHIAVLSDSEKETVALWDLGTERLKMHLPHNGIITSVDFDPEGKYIVTTSDDFFARIWSVETGDQIAQFKHDADVTAAQFSPNGKYVVSAGGRSDRTARLWFWRPDDLIDETISRLSRNLTDQEWLQYFGDEPYRSTCQLAKEG